MGWWEGGRKVGGWKALHVPYIPNSKLFASPFFVSNMSLRTLQLVNNRLIGTLFDYVHKL